MFFLIKLVMKEVLRDRLLRGLVPLVLFFLFIPVLSTFSMRQINELSISISLSLVSVVLFLLSIFLGGISIWKDIDRKYSLTAFSLPCSRQKYILGKYLGVVLFTFFVTVVLTIFATIVVWLVSINYPPAKSIRWELIVASSFFEYIKYVVLISIVFVFSSLSSSFFVPIFGAISVFFVGEMSQQAYDFIQSADSETLPVFVTSSAEILYWLIPNFEAFDLKLYAIYGLDLEWSRFFYTLGYGVTYSLIAISGAAFIFSRREIK